MHLTRCTSLDVLHSDLLHSVYYALQSMYFTLWTMHLTRCISLDVLHSDVLHSVYYFTQCTMHLILCTSVDVLHSDCFTLMYFTRCTMHLTRCTSSLRVLLLCVLDPMYFSEGLCTEEPFAMLSGKPCSPVAGGQGFYKTTYTKFCCWRRARA